MMQHYLLHSRLKVLTAFLALLSTCVCAQTACTFQLKNPDFEEPDIVSKYGAGASFTVNNSQMVGWQTTATDGMIEIWRNGFLGVPAYSGNQFIELNANMVGALYNDANTIPGSTITFGFAHRGREGTDVMELKIGPPGGPYISQGTYSTNKTAWKYYTTSYVVPAGQTTTRFIFSALSTSTGNTSVGNLLDNINVSSVNIDFDLSATSMCGDSLGKIEVNSSKPSGVILEYSTDNINFQTSPIFNNLSSGNYKVYLKANGICIKEKAISIITKPPVLVELGKDTSFCEGSSIVLNAKTSASSFLWNNAQTSKNISVNSSGIYSVEVSDTNGCKGHDTISIKMNSNPIVNIGTDQQICPSSTATFDAGNTGSSYLWSNGASTQTIKVNSSGTYIVEVTDINGCKGKDTAQLIVNSFLNISLGSDKKICAGDSVLLDAGHTGGNYIWNTGATSQSIFAKNNATYDVEVTDKNGCKGRDTINVKVNANPSVNLGSDKEFCEGLSVTLDAGIKDATYLWSTGENTKTISVKNSGTFNVVVTDINGCKGQDTIQSQMNLKSVIELGDNKSICEGDAAVTFDAGNTGANFLWSTGANTQKISVNSSNSYAVQVTNSKGCISTDTVLLIVNTKPILDLGNDAVLCKGNFIELDAKNNGSFFVWNNGATTSKIKVDKEGFYNVKVINAKGCTSSDSINITMDSVANPISYSDTVICEGSTTLLKADITNGNTILWHDNLQQELNVSTSGNFFYSVEKGICKDTFKVTVNALEIPQITISDLSSKNYHCFENDIAPLQLNGKNIDKYLIEWKDTVSNSKQITVNKVGNYSAVVSDGKCSTEVTIELKEYCPPSLFIPNSFTPNNDGTNDVFKSYQNGIIEDYQMNIFNRWGELIYNTNSMNEGWNGKINENNAQIDVYIYTISYNYIGEQGLKKMEKLSGIVNLIR